jgi:hypothetical protein
MNAGPPGLREFRHLAEPRFDRLARWAVALPAFSQSLAKQRGYRPFQTVDNVQKTRYFPSNHRHPTLAAVRPDFETFAETRVSRLH